MKQNNLLGVSLFAFYGAMFLIAYRMFYGEADAKMAFQMIIWLRIAMFSLIVFTMGDPSSIYKPEPRKLTSLAWIASGELWLWFAMFAHLLYTELIVTILMIVLFESARFEAIRLGQQRNY